MPETITLSKIEQAALLGAQRQVGYAQAEMNAIIDEVAKAHKLDPKKDGNDWVLAPDFSKMEYRPQPKPEKGAGQPTDPPGLKIPKGEK